MNKYRYFLDKGLELLAQAKEEGIDPQKLLLELWGQNPDYPSKCLSTIEACVTLQTDLGNDEDDEEFEDILKEYTWKDGRCRVGVDPENRLPLRNMHLCSEDGSHRYSFVGYIA